MSLVAHWPEHIHRAFTDTWIHDGAEQEAEYFFNKWGGYDQETLLEVLSEGTGKERVFVIFALASLGLPTLATLLFPYTSSEDREERWASCICLGRLQDERVFPLLLPLLTEGIEEYERLGKDDSAALHEQYAWCNYHRESVALLLGAWGKREAVPALRHALQTVWQLEQCPGPFEGRWGYLYDDWHYFEWALSYTLGQLGAWGTLLYLGLSGAPLRLVMTYMMLGHLQIKLKGRPYYFVYDVVRRFVAKDDAYANPLVEKNQIRMLLTHQFGFTKSKKRFSRALLKTGKLWKWRVPVEHVLENVFQVLT